MPEMRQTRVVLLVFAILWLVAAPSVVGQQTSEAELVFWQSIADSTDPGDFEAYLERFPDGVFSGLARRRLENAEFLGEVLDALIGPALWELFDGPRDGNRSAAEAFLDRPARQRIQRRLRDAGFDPGEPDGLFGPRTRAAIRAWQQSRQAPQTGYLNGAEVLELTNSAEPADVAAAGDVEVDRDPVDVVRSGFFTRGSPADDVLRIQGTPTSLYTLGDSEVWWYGLSTVTISTSSREVTEWRNSGNLRVRLEPGEPATGPGQVLGTADRLPVPIVKPGDQLVYELGDGVEDPRVLRNVDASYTAAAMRQGLQGTVVVEVVVLPDGAVGDVTVLSVSLGRVDDRTGLWEYAEQGETLGLDEAAIRAARQWRFLPGTRLGEPVAVRATLEFEFTLQ